MQVINWFWTLLEAGDGDIMATPAVPILVLAGAAVISLINLILATKEIEETRQEAPERVRQDDLELHPELAVEEQKPKSPWDD